MLNLSKLEVLREPYPVGLVRDVLPGDLYDLMVKRFPSEDQFFYLTNGYNKFSLSERNNPDKYKEVIKSDWVWQAFHRYIKSAEFMGGVFKALQSKGIELSSKGSFRPRFEFSSLPADGGHILPHTDIPTKVITLIVGMDVPGTWDHSWGGGTDILAPKDATNLLVDYQAPLEAFDIVHTFKHEPNEAIIFVKTTNSWHSVGPITGPFGKKRRTLTINIEKIQ